jgi:drug/metabolite transporter (DMT)-like permease
MRSLPTMLLLALLWGLSIPITKIGLLTIPPLTLTALRFALAMPFLVPILIVGRRVPPRDLLRFAALGLLGVGVGQVAQTYGIAGTSASVGTIISATIPVFVVIFAAIRLKQPVSGLQKMGLLVAFLGIAVVALDGADATAFRASLIGAALMLLSCVTIAFYYVWSVELARKYGAGPLAAWSTMFGFIALLPWAGWEASRTSFDLTAQGMAAAAYLGVFVTVVGLFLWLHLLRTVPASTAASVQYLQPIIGIAASAVIFGDKLGLLFLAGVVLVLCGLALTMTTRRAVSVEPRPAG